MQHPNEPSHNTVATPPSIDVVRWKFAKWVIATIDPVMLVVHLTIVYTLFLVADDFVLARISESFGELPAQSSFVAHVLQGTKVFGALATAVGYVLHLTYSLYLQARGVAKKIRENEEGV